jgi:hypothetical protein
MRRMERVLLTTCSGSYASDCYDYVVAAYNGMVSKVVLFIKQANEKCYLKMKTC